MFWVLNGWMLLSGRALLRMGATSTIQRGLRMGNKVMTINPSMGYQEHKGLTVDKISIYVPDSMTNEALRKYRDEVKASILQDCLENPAKYLED